MHMRRPCDMPGHGHAAKNAIKYKGKGIMHKDKKDKGQPSEQVDNSLYPLRIRCFFMYYFWVN